MDARDRGSLFDAAPGCSPVPGQDGYYAIRAERRPQQLRTALRPGLPGAAEAGGSHRLRDLLRRQRSQRQFSSAGQPDSQRAHHHSAGGGSAAHCHASVYTQHADQDRRLPAGSQGFQCAESDRPHVLCSRPVSHRLPLPAAVQLQLQYEAARNWLLEASYEGSKGTKLGDRLNLNQEPFEYALDGRNTQANRRYPFINGLFAYDQSTATSNYNSVNFKVERRFSSGLAFLANYSIQKTLERGVPGVIGTFTQNGGTSLPLDSYDTRAKSRYSPLDVPQTLTASYSYELPSARTRNIWAAAGMAGKNRRRLDGRRHHQHCAAASRPMSASAAGSPTSRPSMFRIASPASQSRAESRAGPVLQSGRVFRAARRCSAHTGVRVQTYGNSAKRPVHAAPAPKLGFRPVQEHPHHRSGLNLQFRSEFFNLFNTPQFGLACASSASLTVGNAIFGKLVTSADVGRQIQFGLKLLF